MKIDKKSEASDKKGLFEYTYVHRIQGIKVSIEVRAINDIVANTKAWKAVANLYKATKRNRSLTTKKDEKIDILITDSYKIKHYKSYIKS